MNNIQDLNNLSNINSLEITDPETKYSKSEITIINLNVLGKLKNGIKLNTQGKYLTLDDSVWYQPFKRFYYGSNRNSCYEKISELITEVHELFQQTQTMDMSKEEFIKYIIPVLERAKKGLISLKDTYHDDKTFTSQIDVSVGTISRLIDKNRLVTNSTNNSTNVTKLNNPTNTTTTNYYDYEENDY